MGAALVVIFQQCLPPRDVFAHLRLDGLSAEPVMLARVSC
jgi:hypothetical protein